MLGKAGQKAMKRLLLSLLFFVGLQHAALAASCGSYPFTLLNNTTADATQVMANFNNVRNCVINNAAGSGVNTDITSLTGLSTPLSVPQGGTPVFIGGTSTGSADAQVVSTTTPIGFGLTSGYRVTFIAGFTNLTTTTTLNVNSTGATVVKRVGSGGIEAIGENDIRAGNVIEAMYDGTEFVLLTTPVPLFNVLTTLASGTTTDLGTIGSHNVSITGTTTITAFGSTASATNPVYYLGFTGAVTLTYNATSLILPSAANIVTAAGDQAVAQYLGSGNWRIVAYTPASGASAIPSVPMCGATNLKFVNNAGTPNTKIDYTADASIMLNGTIPKTAFTISGTIDLTSVGTIDGIQASRAASTFYNIYFLTNGSTVGGFAVASGTGLSAPSGYVFSCRLGAMQTDASTNLFRTLIRGNDAQMVLTSATNTTFAAQTIGSNSATNTSTTVTGSGKFAPTTATHLRVVVLSPPAAAWTSVNPNSSGWTTVNPGMCAVQATTAMSTNVTNLCDIVLESSAVFYSAGGGGVTATNAAAVVGWKDAVNAN